MNRSAQLKVAQGQLDRSCPPEPKPSLYEDYEKVGEILADAKVGQDWLVDAIAYSLCNDDPDYLTREVARHCKPIVEAQS